MRYLWLGLVLILSGAPARAETVRVLSGEHPGFTRLVFQFDQPTSWRFGRSGAGYELRLGRKDVVFDLGGVFARIPRDRLADLSPTRAGGLAFVVAPGNRAVPYDLREAVLVIDIRTGPPPPDSPHEQALPATGATQAESAEALVPAAMVRPAPDLAWLGLDRALAPVESGAEKAAGMVGPRASDLPGLGDTRIRAAQGLLVNQIARAAAQGLLVPTGPTQPLPSGQIPVAEVADSAPPLPAPRPPAPPQPRHPQVNVTAQTSIDRDSASIVPRALTRSMDQCVEAALVDVAAWGGDADPATLPATLISTRRAAVLGEFDRASAAAVGDLVRAYLYLGFGAEAAATLGAFHVSVAEADLLLSLAAIMDGEAPAPASRLRAMADCPGPVALWALLANDTGADLPDLEMDAVLLGFSALPLHLRRLLGPAVAGRLVGLGLIEAAAAVQNAMTRAPGDPGAGSRIISARIDQVSGAQPDSENGLLEVILGDGPDAAKALVLYVDGRLAQHLPIQRKIAEQAAALAFEHRNVADGPALKRVEVLAQAAAGAFGTGFSALRRWQARGGIDQGAVQIVGPLFALLASDASDEVFVREVFASGAGSPRMPALPYDAALAVSERMLDLGFAAEARAVHAASAPESPETRLFMARVAMAQADGAGALRAIAGLTGEEAVILRGRALNRIGNHAAAEAVFFEAGDLPQAARAAWAAGDWARYAALSDNGRAEILGRLGVLPPAPGDGAGPETAADPAPADGVAADEGVLERNRRLLEESRATREALADLRATLAPDPEK